jgi:hypothetical protein
MEVNIWRYWASTAAFFFPFGDLAWPPLPRATRHWRRARSLQRTAAIDAQAAAAAAPLSLWDDRHMPFN